MRGFSMNIPNLTIKSISAHQDLPFFINKYHHSNYFDLQVHTHEFIEIVYVCDGKGFHQYNDITYPVSKGDLYIINSQIPHCFYPTDVTNSQHLVVYNLCFLPEFISGINIQLPSLTEITDLMLYKSLYQGKIMYAPDLKLSGAMRTEIEQLYEKLYLEFSSSSINYVDILRLSLCELLLKIHRFYKLTISSTDTKTIKYRHQLILNCIEYLKTNYTHKITIEELSSTFFLSKSYLSSLFKKATGSGVVEYLQHIRIEKACELLTMTDLPITEICGLVGYTDYRFFNKSFKKIHGCTAQEYRKSQV